MESEELVNGDVGKVHTTEAEIFGSVWSSDVDCSAFWLLISQSVSLFST